MKNTTRGSALIMVLIVTSTIAWVTMLSWRSSFLGANTALLHQKIEQRMRSAQAFAYMVMAAVQSAKPDLLYQIPTHELLILSCEAWPLGDDTRIVAQAYGHSSGSHIYIRIILTDTALKQRLYTITYSMSKNDMQADEYDNRWSIKEWREMA
jgi:hypothetical protein